MLNTNEMDIAPLREIIEKYQYGQFNILDNGMQIKANPGTKQIMLDPFYRHGQNHTIGSCAELMNTAYKEIREKHPTLRVVRATGRDPIYFAMKGSIHSFLLVSEENIMGDRVFTGDPGEISDFLNKDPILVDPSLKKVKRFKKTGYSAHTLTNQGVDMPYSNTCVVNNKGGVPLGMDSKNNMVYLLADFRYANPIRIAITHPGEEVVGQSLDDISQSLLVTDEDEIRMFIDLLKEREIIETTEPFSVERDIIIR